MFKNLILLIITAFSVTGSFELYKNIDSTHLGFLGGWIIYILIITSGVFLFGYEFTKTALKLTIVIKNKISTVNNEITSNKCCNVHNKEPLIKIDVADGSVNIKNITSYLIYAHIANFIMILGNFFIKNSSSWDHNKQFFLMLGSLILLIGFIFLVKTVKKYANIFRLMEFSSSVFINSIKCFFILVLIFLSGGIGIIHI